MVGWGPASRAWAQPPAGPAAIEVANTPDLVFLAWANGDPGLKMLLSQFQP